MANETTSTTLNDLLPSIVAEAMFVASERSIMRGLVKNYTLPMGSGKTLTVPRYPIQTAADLTEGNDMSNTAVSTDGAVLTVKEVGIMTTVFLQLESIVADVSVLFDGQGKGGEGLEGMGILATQGGCSLSSSCNEQ